MIWTPAFSKRANTTFQVESVKPRVCNSGPQHWEASGQLGGPVGFVDRIGEGVDATDNWNIWRKANQFFVPAAFVSETMPVVDFTIGEGGEARRNASVCKIRVRANQEVTFPLGSSLDIRVKDGPDQSLLASKLGTVVPPDPGGTLVEVPFPDSALLDRTGALLRVELVINGNEGFVDYDSIAIHAVEWQVETIRKVWRNAGIK